jgi:tetratricopeptide (TPR) repeat protein
MTTQSLRWIWGVIVFLTLLLSGSAGADQDRKFDGVTKDFFTAGEDPETERYLTLVEHAHTDRVMLWVRQDQINNAFADCKYTLDRFSNHPRGLILLESVAKLMQAPTLPTTYYEKALADFPQYPVTHAQFGHYLIEIGRADEGIAKLKRAIEMDSKLKPAYVWLAEGYYKKGDHEQARLAARKARALGYTGEFPGDLQSSSAR